MRHDDRVEGRQREGHGGAGHHVPQRAGPGGAVEQEPVTVTGKEERHGPGLTIDDRRQGAHQFIVEKCIEPSALLRACLLYTSRCV